MSSVMLSSSLSFKLLDCHLYGLTSQGLKVLCGVQDMGEMQEKVGLMEECLEWYGKVCLCPYSQMNAV